MNRFDSSGKLQLRQCIGTLRHSEYKACYLIYISDGVGQKPHTYIELSYVAVKIGSRDEIFNYAKKYALTKGIHLVEVY